MLAILELTVSDCDEEACFAASSQPVERRYDAEDGAPLTKQEMRQRYAGIYDLRAIRQYWESCDVRSNHAKAADCFVIRFCNSGSARDGMTLLNDCK